MHDAQYFEHEYPNHVGWGRSSVDRAVESRCLRCARVMLFHHDPLHSDDQLRALEARARALWGTNGNAPQLAYEGMKLALDTEVEIEARCSA